MRADIAELVTKCDAVAIVNDITNSRGALLEITIARELRLAVAPLETWLTADDVEEQ